MAKLKFILFFLLIPLITFSYTLDEGETLMETGKLNDAASYFIHYSSSLVQGSGKKQNVTNIKDYSLSKYYLSMSYYKMGELNKAYDALKSIYSTNERKVGFNVLMGLIIIAIGQRQNDSGVIKQGYSYLKKGSLYEGIRLRNSFIIDKTQVIRRKRVYYIIKRLNNLDPQGKINYKYYHTLLFNYYKKNNYLSPLSVEYEKLLIIDPDNREYYEKLFELYKQLKYYDNLSYILQMFIKKFYSQKDRKIFIKYLLQKINADLLGRNYLECERNLTLFSLNDLNNFSIDEKMEYFSISLDLYSILNIKTKLLSLLQEITSMNEKKYSMDFDIHYERALLSLYENSTFYSKNAQVLDSLFQNILNKFKKYYPDSIYTYLLIGEYYYFQGKYDAAQTIFSQMANLPKNNFDAHFTYILFLSRMAHRIYVDNKPSGDFGKLNDIFVQCFTEINNIKTSDLRNIDDSKKFELFKIIGNLYFLKGLTFGTIDEELSGDLLYNRDNNMDHAIDYYQKALVINGNDTVILNYLGWAYIYKRKFTDAFDTYRTILQLSPFDNNAKFQMKFIKNKLLRSY